MASGTIGAAMSASLSKKRAIALSYGTLLHSTPPTSIDPAHTLSTRILKYLWENWGTDEGGLRAGEVDLYNVNIPLVGNLLSEDGPKLCWTTIWRNSYERLFEAVEPTTKSATVTTDPGGPAALSAEKTSGIAEGKGQELLFAWASRVEGAEARELGSIPRDADAFAINRGDVSITPLRASFAEPPFVCSGQLMI
jgi:tubulin---tyrosine ligase